MDRISNPQAFIFVGNDVACDQQMTYHETFKYVLSALLKNNT